MSLDPFAYDGVALPIHNNGYILSNISELDFFTLKHIEKYEIKRCMASLLLLNSTNDNVIEIIHKIMKHTNSRLLECKSIANSMSAVFQNENGVFICSIWARESAIDYISSRKNVDSEYCDMNIWLYTDIDYIKALSKQISKIKFKCLKEDATVSWVITDKQGNIVKERCNLSKNKPIKDCYYPFIKDGVKDFQDRYEKSTSPILILLGPPGTGKTSFIRDYMYRHKKNALISYDADIMRTDNFFLKFLKDAEELLVLEDYDVFLRSREETDNKIMNKFLNLAEGLVDISKKKIIFTANVEKSDIDFALVRPGRCFDVVEFRPLFLNEAKTVITQANLPEDNVIHPQITLAEIFSNKKNTIKKNVLGFN